MITALIPLPNFMLPSSSANIVRGSVNAETFDDGMNSYIRGRDIYFGEGATWHKYKITIREPYQELMENAKNFLHNQAMFAMESDIVFVTNRPINLDTYESDPHGIIYPVYGKSCGGTYVFPRAIERFLRSLSFDMDKELITPLDLLEEKYAQTMGHLLDLDSSFFAKGFAPVYCSMSLCDMCTNLDSSSLITVTNEQLLSRSLFSETFLWMADAVSWQMLKPYVNMFTDRTNNVRNGAVGYMFNWKKMASDLNRQLVVLSCPDPVSSCMSQLIYYAHKIGDDFFVDVDTSDPAWEVPDMYLHRVDIQSSFVVGEAQRNEEIKLFVMLLSRAVGHAWAGKKIHIHRSCMEDITVTDIATGNILVYIDLVWWTVAASNSLIDRIHGS